MPTPLTGSMGWSGLHPFQFGGPPLVNTYSRTLAKTALPLIAHIYDNDGVTFKGSFSVLDRPVLNPTLTNGGYNQVLLSGASAFPSATYGQSTYGVAVYGSRVLQGNVIRLTEDGGPWAGFVYGGIVEDLPESISPTGVSHQILLSPFAVELDDTFSQALYTTPVDVSQIVRDAVALTRHCHCDQVSVPVSIGVLVPSTGQLDFRNQPVRQIIDTARSMAGPTWFWHVDELGRVWFQPMGSAAGYTVPLVQYEERTKSASIQDRKNKVVAIGGAPAGSSANVNSVADDLVSQQAIGIRALSPPLHIPTISDKSTLDFITSNILAVLNRTWLRVDLKLLPSVGQRIHASQPGGAMLRYWEPTVNPLQESSVGAGYTGPFVVQTLNTDGLRQEVVAGDIPVTSQTDITNMVQQWARRAAAFAFVHAPVMLSDPQQVFTGSLQVGSAQLATGQTVGRMEVGGLIANGISPAQTGWRINDANGNPLADSLGLIGVANVLATETLSPSTMAGSGAGWATVQTISGSGANFTLTRQGNILCASYLSSAMTAGAANYMALYHAIWTQAGALISRKQVTATQFTQNINYFPVLVSVFTGLAAGAYQFRQEFALDVGTTSCTFGTGSTGIAPTAEVIQLGA